MGVVVQKVVSKNSFCRGALIFLKSFREIRTASAVSIDFLIIVRRGVAQPGSALGSGPRGRRFKSYRPDSYL